jgi:hypothetical protein
VKIDGIILQSFIEADDLADQERILQRLSDTIMPNGDIAVDDSFEIGDSSYFVE